MKQEIRNQIREIDKKIRNVSDKINQILQLGGLIPNKFEEELNSLNLKKKELEATPCSDLEQKFKDEFKKVTKQINIHLENVYQELNKAIKLSEKHGIPFDAKVREMSDTYLPETFENLWNEIDNSVLEELDIYTGKNAGWQQSQIC